MIPIPCSAEPSWRESTTDAAAPAIIPPAAILIVRASTRRRTAPGAAPSAIRTPSSRVRSDTRPRHHAIESDGRQQQRQAAKDTESPLLPSVPWRCRHRRLLPSGARPPPALAGVPGAPPRGRRPKGDRVTVGPDHERHRLGREPGRLGQRPVHLRAGGIAQAFLRDVTDDADHGDAGAVTVQTGADARSDRVGGWPEPPGECVVDDRDRLGTLTVRRR